LPCDTDSDFNQYVKFAVETDKEVHHIYLVYRPPNNNNENLLKLTELLGRAEKNSHFFGDFNLPGINWEEGRARGREEEFLNVVEENAFHQMVPFATHIKGNCLDLILSNSPESVTAVEEKGRVGKSDHSVILAVMSLTVRKEKRDGEVRNWRRANWDGIKEGLQTATWPEDEDETTTEEAWGILREKIDELVETHVPKTRIRSNYTSWMTRDLIREVRGKRRLWKKAKNGTAEDRERYKEAERKVRNHIRNAKRKEEKKLANEKGRNSKPFYNYIKRRTKTRTPVGPLKTEEGVAVTDPLEMAEMINEFFVSVFTREEANDVPEPKKRPVPRKMRRMWITSAKVKKKIKELNPNSAPGPDGITPKLLKNCCEEISPILAMIYRKSVKKGEVPTEWKQANVVPIFKKGSKAKPGNYRPVSLTCIPCKIVESIIRDELVEHLERNSLVSKAQHGFMRNRSCTTNLLEFFETVTEKADKGKAMDIIYLDFAKAFDKVPHKRLVKKLEAFGVSKEVVEWIEEWLRKRQNRVVVDGRRSTWKEVLSGVPQGSVLGPILFVIFINDLEDEILKEQLMRMFADDTKVGQVVESEEERQQLQETLERLVEWTKRWGMAFNVEKCHVMHVGRNNAHHQYSMNGKELKRTVCERDVGVLIAENLKPTEHCKKAVRTAGAVLTQILKAFHFRDRHTYMNLYMQYVRPHLEYAAPAWSPWTREDTENIERVQERAVRQVSGLKGTSYQEKLQELGMQTLEERRREMDRVQAFKILRGIDKVDKNQWFQMVGTDRTTRARQGADTLQIARSQHEFRRQFFSQRAARDWNSLPAEARACLNVKTFKAALGAIRAPAATAQ